MVATTERYRELVADLTPECAALREAEVVSIRGPPAANQASVRSDEFDVIPVTKPPRLGEALARSYLSPLTRIRFFAALAFLVRGFFGCVFARLRHVRGRTSPQSCLKGFLHLSGVDRDQFVLLDEGSVGPHRRVITGRKLIEFDDQSIAQFRRCFSPKDFLGRLNLRIAAGGRRGDEATVLITVQAALATSVQSITTRRLARRYGQIGRIEIILAGNTDKSKECITSGIGQCRSHPVWRCRATDRRRPASLRRPIPPTNEPARW